MAVIFLLLLRYGGLENMNKYYYINGSAVCEAEHLNSDTVKTRQALGNMYKSEYNCVDYYQYLKVRKKLIDVANRLNRNNPIDWENLEQTKYVLVWHYIVREVQQVATNVYYSGAIYSTDSNFINEALKNINVIDLGMYLRYNPLEDVQYD